MILQNNTETIKQVGMNGQISLGKEYAGKQIQISKLDDGTLIIKAGKFIPDNERWLYRDNNLEKLEAGIMWAESTKKHNRGLSFEEFKKKILADD